MYPEALGRVPWNLIDCDCCPLTLFPTHTHPHTPHVHTLKKNPSSLLEIKMSSHGAFLMKPAIPYF